MTCGWLNLWMQNHDFGRSNCKVIYGFSIMPRVGVPNPCVVQRSTVLFCVCLLWLRPWPKIHPYCVYSLQFNFYCRVIYCMKKCICFILSLVDLEGCYQYNCNGHSCKVLLWTSALISLRYTQWHVSRCEKVSSLTKIALTCTISKQPPPWSMSGGCRM